MRREAVLRRLQAGGVGLPFFWVLALYWCWQDSYWAGLSFGEGVGVVSSFCGVIASMVPVAVAVAKSSIAESWLDSPRCMVLAGLAGTAGSFGLMVDASPVGASVLASIEGVAVGYFCLTMIRTCVVQRPSSVALLFGASACAGFLLDAVLGLCPSEFARAGRMMLPLLMGLLLLVEHRGGAADAASPESSDGEVVCGTRDIVASVLFVGIFALSFGLIRGMSAAEVWGAGVDEMLSLGMRALSVILFVVLYLVKRLALGSALIVGMMLSVGGLLVIGCDPAAPPVALAGRLLAETGYTFCEIMTFVLLSRLTWLLGRRDLRMVAAGSLATSVGAALGMAWALATSAGLSISVDVAVCAFLLVGASLLLLNANVWMQLRGMKVTAGAAESGEAERLREVSRLYGLTQREADMLAYLLKGRSVPYIAKVDSISENTVKSHMKHLYAKLGVHSRQELIDLLDETYL